MDTSDIIAGLALLISAISLGWTWKLQRQQLLLNKQQRAKNKEEDEAKKKADILAMTEKTNSGFDVIIKNIGLSTAHRIRIDSDDLTRENTGIASFEFHKLTPYPLLNTNDSFRIKFFTSGSF